MVEKIPAWIERILLPKLSEISGEMKAINARIDSLEKTMSTRINSLENRIDSLEKRFLVSEEIADIKARLMELEKKVYI